MLKGINDPALAKRVVNVHQDDIHGIIQLPDNIIVSGSKDGNVKSFKYVDWWNYSLWYGKTIAKNKKNYRNKYEHWVTAIDKFSDDSIVVGYRDGRFLSKAIRNNNTYTDVNMNDLILDDKPKQYYKERNKHRITSVKCLEIENRYTALIGMPQQFYHYDCSTNKVLGSFTFDKPDWAYGFCSLAPNKIAAIHSCSLSSFEFNFNVDEEASKSMWDLSHTYIEEKGKSSKRSNQRPFISSVVPFEKNGEYTSKVTLSFFGGKTMVFDVEVGKATHLTQEHQQRVWQAVPLSDHEYISCADDATVKIWDVRLAESIHTYKNHPGRVSSVAVLSRDNKTFVAGTCSDNPFQDEFKGQFFFYDIRKNGASSSSSSSNDHSSGKNFLEDHFEKLKI